MQTRSIYLALAARFCQGKRILSKEQFAALGGAGNQSGDCSDGVLMSSRGGNRYDRTFREALIDPHEAVRREGMPVRLVDEECADGNHEQHDRSSVAVHRSIVAKANR